MSRSRSSARISRRVGSLSARNVSLADMIAVHASVVCSGARLSFAISPTTELLPRTPRWAQARPDSRRAGGRLPPLMTPLRTDGRTSGCPHAGRPFAHACAVLMVSLLALAGCRNGDEASYPAGPTSGGPPRRGGHIVFVREEDPDYLDPGLSYGSYSAPL